MNQTATLYMIKPGLVLAAPPTFPAYPSPCTWEAVPTSPPMTNHMDISLPMNKSCSGVTARELLQ